MQETTSRFRRLDPDRIVETVKALKGRIEGRFPGSGLGHVCAELLMVAEETVERTRWIQKPHLALRFAAGVLSFAIVILLILMVTHIRQFQFEEYTNFIQALDASIGSVVFIGAAIIFLLSYERRIKRQRALHALHELRSLAHIVDMHQLTKDPESYFAPREKPVKSLQRSMTPYQLNRYLDYCSESLALISKIAALYVQDFPDTVLLDAVDDVEDLTAGFSRKIWQKITIIETFGRNLPPGHSAQPE